MSAFGESEYTIREYWSTAALQLIKQKLKSAEHTNKRKRDDKAWIGGYLKHVDDGRVVSSEAHSTEDDLSTASRLMFVRALLANACDVVRSGTELCIDTFGMPVSPTDQGAIRVSFECDVIALDVRYHRKRIETDSGVYEGGRAYARCGRAILPHTSSLGEILGKRKPACSATSQGIAREIRLHAAQRPLGLVDVDFKSCHLLVLNSLSRRYDTGGPAYPTLARAAADPAAFRSEIATAQNISLEYAKIVVTALLYGSNVAKQLRDWKSSLREEIVSDPCEALLTLRREIVSLREALLRDERERSTVDALRAHARTQKSNFSNELKSEEEIKRSIFSHLAQKYEALALDVVIDVLRRSGFVVHSLLFDGLLVFGDETRSIRTNNLDSALRVAEARIARELSLTMQLDTKSTSCG